MKYATFDAAATSRGNITGYYSPDVHGPRRVGNRKNPATQIPATAVEITDEEWRLALNSPEDYWVDPKTKLFGDAPPITSEELTLRGERDRSAIALKELEGLDRVSIRSIREFIVAKFPDAPEELKAQEQTATTLRGRGKP